MQVRVAGVAENVRLDNGRSLAVWLSIEELHAKPESVVLGVRLERPVHEQVPQARVAVAVQRHKVYAAARAAHLIGEDHGQYVIRSHVELGDVRVLGAVGVAVSFRCRVDYRRQEQRPLVPCVVQRVHILIVEVAGVEEIAHAVFQIDVLLLAISVRTQRTIPLDVQ